MARYVTSPAGTVAASPAGGIRGGRNMLVPGVMVKSVHAQANTGQSNWNDVVVELLVDPTAVGAIDDLMRGLTALANGTHQVQQPGSVMTSSAIYPGTMPAVQWMGEDELDEIEGEMERDPEDLEDPVTLVTLKHLIEERMDGIDSALRLAIGE